MNPYEEILSVINTQSNRGNRPLIQLGIMDSPKTCSIGTLLLEEEDIMVMEYLKTGYHKAVDELQPQKQDESTFVEPLKKGDMVAVCRINDELYLILGRLVNP